MPGGKATHGWDPLVNIDMLYEKSHFFNEETIDNHHVLWKNCGKSQFLRGKVVIHSG